MHDAIYIYNIMKEINKNFPELEMTFDKINEFNFIHVNNQEVYESEKFQLYLFDLNERIFKDGNTILSIVL